MNEKKMINFTSLMLPFGLISLVLVVGSLFLIVQKGLNFGTDFRGGLKLQYEFPNNVPESKIREALEKKKVGDFSIQKVGSPDENHILIKLPKNDQIVGIAEELGAFMKKELLLETLVLEQEESVGPKAGAELRKKASLAVIVSWILILIYIGFRFDFVFAPGAIIALIHDVLVTLGAFVLTQREVSLTVVAALLTITGYSINDTIVIYDRIRENLQTAGKESLASVVNRSMNETLSRTIITTLTVFVVVVLMFVFGEGEFQNFGFAMIVGCIAGTYSTVFVATSLYLLIRKFKKIPA